MIPQVKDSSRPQYLERPEPVFEGLKNPEDVKIELSRKREAERLQKRSDTAEYLRFAKQKDRQFQKKLTDKERMQVKRDQLGPLARKAAMIEQKRVLQNFNRFNQTFVEAYNSEKRHEKLPKMESDRAYKNPLEEFINESTVKDFE